MNIQDHLTIPAALPHDAGRAMLVGRVHVPSLGAVLVQVRPDSPSGPEQVKALQDFVKQSIAPYKYPRAIEFVADLPRTGTGKLQRFRLRDRG